MTKKAHIDSPIIPTDTKDSNFCIPGGGGENDDCEWWFCRPFLLDAFGLPKQTRRVQFRAFAKPGKDRFEVTLPKKATIDETIATVDGRRYTVDDDTLEQIRELTGRARKTFYVKVFYWTGV